MTRPISAESHRLPALAICVLLVSWSHALPPEECIVLMRRARIAQMLDDGETRISTLRQAKQQCPEVPEVLFELSDYYRGRLDAEESSAEVRAQLRALMRDGDVEIPKGAITRYIEADDTTGADLQLMLDMVSQRLPLAPEDVSLIRAKVQLETRLGQFESARTTVSRLIEKTDALLVRDYAIVLDIRLERYENALSMMRELQRGHNDRYYKLLEMILLAKLERFDELYTVIEPLLGDSNMVSSLHGSLAEAAWAFYDAGNPERAERLFRTLHRNKPGDADLSRIVLHLFATEEERSSVESALDRRWRAETDPYRLLREGSTRLASGDEEGGLALLERAVKELPDSKIAWSNIGLAAMKLERWERAEQAYLQAIRVESDQAQAHYGLGVARVMLGKHEDAVGPLERSVAIDSGQTSSYYYLYLCYKQLELEQEALEALELYNRGQE